MWLLTANVDVANTALEPHICLFSLSRCKEKQRVFHVRSQEREYAILVACIGLSGLGTELPARKNPHQRAVQVRTNME